MGQPLHILNIEDSQADFLLVERHLSQQGLHAVCVRVDNSRDLAQALASDRWDLVLTDFSIPAMDFLESFAYIQSHAPDLPVILVSGSVGEEQAVELLKMGVWDFVLKENLARLVPAIERSLRELKDRRARLAAELSVREKERRFRSIFDRSPIAIGIGQADSGVLVEVNDAWLNQYGYERHEVIGRTTKELNLYVNVSDRSEIIRLISGCGRVINHEIQQRRKNGDIIDALYSAEIIQLGEESLLQVMMTDITEQKRNEAAQEATVELLRICTMADTLPSLMQALMDYFQSISGCEAIGVRLRDGDDYPYYVTRGFSEEFVLAEKQLCAYDQQGELIRDFSGHPALGCMCGNILCSRFDLSKPYFTVHGSFWSSCTSELLATSTDGDRLAKTRNRCNGEGYESVALMPLRSNTETFGLIQFNDKRTGRFTAEKIALLENLVDYVAIALAKLKTEEALRDDIRERKRAEHALLEATQRLQLATASASIGVWDWDVTKNELQWDEQMHQIYGIPPGVFTDCVQAWQDALHPDDRERAIAASVAALDGDQDFHTEFRIVRPDGVLRYITATARVVRDDQGVGIRMVGINRDVTVERTLEGQLQQSQKMESVGRLAGGVAHDFNNMLSVIIGYVHMGLSDLDPTQPLHHYLAEISKAANRSADLTRQLLAFARKQTIAPKVLDLNETVTGMLKMLHRLIGEDINLIWQPEAGLWPVEVDPSQIDQILVNLCVNARDAILGVGKITIKAENCTVDQSDCIAHTDFLPDEFVRITFSDDGCGMDEETLGHIFEPFFTTKELGKGTGLGLSTVYGIVKQNSGFIHVESDLGSGTTFMIYLRRYKGTDKHEGTVAGVKSDLCGEETILLVEDEQAILDMAAMILTRQGYTVLQASTPTDAVRQARDHSGEIDLLMTDVILPEMNGLDLAKNLLSIHPQIKSLFMSGYTADILEHHGEFDEGLHFIHKPFSLPDMAAKVREVLDSN